MSSRNAYLSQAGRDTAARIYRTLSKTAERLQAGDRDFAALEEEGLSRLSSVGFRPDYYVVRRATDLAPPQSDDKRLVVLTAAHLGGARLIDNLEVELA